MKFPDMNQYITLLFSLLGEFFLPHRTQPPGAGDRPPRSPAISSDCSSGSPDPERRMARRTPFLARSAGACPPRSLA